ncbi:hypothetical protein [Salinimonas chungwhensis]|uniref:hypothetical protein n=1 Tax=Salinimonas chungwhensis TaxID=265425 RepID=UPI0003686100|nr:hypothetical protein [Salinimonas chungwhensis]
MNAAELSAMLGENADISIKDLSAEQRKAIKTWQAQAAQINAILNISEPHDPTDPVPNPVPEPDDRPRDPRIN